MPTWVPETRYRAEPLTGVWNTRPQGAEAQAEEAKDKLLLSEREDNERI